MFNEGTSDHSKARGNMAVVVLLGDGMLVSSVVPSKEAIKGGLEDSVPFPIKTSLPLSGHR